ncbi:MAG: type II toxin-antitoxin system VapC family toxin [Gallionellaceae bacterium]|nr:type II toxin-antitoxin system VapC family toxin [Gallionellaceae bacterium]
MPERSPISWQSPAVRAESSLLLDTHIWLWLACGVQGKIRPAALRTIEQAGQRRTLFVSIISVGEISLLESKQRIALPMPTQKWVARALGNPEIKLIGLDDPEIVLDSCHLPEKFHADPADRFLIATARARNATLVTADQRILDYSKLGHVKTLAP